MLICSLLRNLQKNLDITEPLYNEIFGITKDILCPAILEYMEPMENVRTAHVFNLKISKGILFGVWDLLQNSFV